MRVLVIDSKFPLSAKTDGDLTLLTMREVSQDDLRVIEKIHPDLIYLACRFPGYATVGEDILQGPQVLMELREVLPHVPVVGISSIEPPDVWENIVRDNPDVASGLSGVISLSKLQELFPHFKRRAT